MHLSIHYIAVLEGCISQYIRLLYWGDASLNTLDCCIGGMHLVATVQSNFLFSQFSSSKLNALELLQQLADRASDECILDRLVPFMVI